MWKELLQQISAGKAGSLARCISLIENDTPGFAEFMQTVTPGNTPLIGITGPPGAGKSTLTDALIGLYIAEQKKVAVLCVDPSSPFNNGALLGDRVRMSRWYDNPDVYIRSLATRGSLGGLSPKIIEITDLLKLSGFDHIIVETVGVGQSEIEIAGLADVTAVLIVPEAGDEIQTMKAGLMEIADLFIVNKADRPGADLFVKNLRQMLAPAFSNHTQEVEIVKTAANTGQGVSDVKAAIEKIIARPEENERKNRLMAEKAYRLLVKERMRDIDKIRLQQQVALAGKNFNLYRFVEKLK